MWFGSTYSTHFVIFVLLGKMICIVPPSLGSRGSDVIFVPTRRLGLKCHSTPQLYKQPKGVERGKIRLRDLSSFHECLIFFLWLLATSFYECFKRQLFTPTCFSTQKFNFNLRTLQGGGHHNLYRTIFWRIFSINFYIVLYLKDSFIIKYLNLLNYWWKFHKIFL
jgi:hypothetical protein